MRCQKTTFPSVWPEQLSRTRNTPGTELLGGSPRNKQQNSLFSNMSCPLIFFRPPPPSRSHRANLSLTSAPNGQVLRDPRVLWSFRGQLSWPPTPPHFYFLLLFWYMYYMCSSFDKNVQFSKFFPCFIWFIFVGPVYSWPDVWFCSHWLCNDKDANLFYPKDIS